MRPGSTICRPTWPHDLLLAQLEEHSRPKREVGSSSLPEKANRESEAAGWPSLF